MGRYTVCEMAAILCRPQCVNENGAIFMQENTLKCSVQNGSHIVSASMCYDQLLFPKSPVHLPPRLAYQMTAGRKPDICLTSCPMDIMPWGCDGVDLLLQTRQWGYWAWWSTVYYSDVIMSAVASQITSVLTVCSIVCSGTDQRKHQSSTSLVFVGGNHQWLVNYLPKRASNTENVSLWWRYHVWQFVILWMTLFTLVVLKLECSEIGQYHACWCPGDVHRQVISNHDIEYGCWCPWTCIARSSATMMLNI